MVGPIRIEAPSHPASESLIPNVLSISGRSRPNESVGKAIAQLAPMSPMTIIQRYGTTDNPVTVVDGIADGCTPITGYSKPIDQS